MSTFNFAEAQYERFRNEHNKIADRLRSLADEVERVPLLNHRGERRQPVAVVGNITHVVLWGVANLKLDLMASWAESVYEVEADAVAHPEQNSEQLLPEFRSLCNHSIHGGTTTCVLTRGHTLPKDDGLLVHVDSDGMIFS